MEVSDSTDFEEIDAGFSAEDDNVPGAFVSPYKTYQFNTDSECETDIELGQSPVVKNASLNKLKTVRTFKQRKARKRLVLKERDTGITSGSSSSDETENETPEMPARNVSPERPRQQKRKKDETQAEKSSEDERIPALYQHKKGKSRIPPPGQLANIVCCSATCLAFLSLVSMQTARDTFTSQSKFDQRQWIVRYFTQHSIKNDSDLFEYMYILGTTVICANAWRYIYGITERRFYSIKKLFQEGLRSFNPPNSGKKDRHNTEVLESLSWLEYYAMTFGDKLPNTDKYHLPSCLTKKDVYQLLRDDFEVTGRTPCSESYFYELWQTKFEKKIAIPKENRLAKCDLCTRIKFKLENQQISKEKRLSYMQRREKHLKLQNAERQKYYKHAEKARRYPHKYICMIVDGMDQNKTNVPHFVRLAKTTANMWSLKTHLTGVIVHGILAMGFFDIMQWPHDSNLTLNIILFTLWQIKDRLPSVLYLQMDNCYRENKNKWVFALCSFLVEKKVFDKIKVNFLMTGHTHEDIDQLFSRFSTWLKRHSAVTLPKLMIGFEKCFTPAPIAIELKTIFDVRSWLDPHVNKVYQHSAPHCFKFIRNEEGKAVFFTKKWSGYTNWIPCTTFEDYSEYLLMTMPVGIPAVLQPDFQDLNIEKLRLDINGVRQFMNETESEWWSKWFETIPSSQDNEDIELDATDERLPNYWCLNEILEAAARRPSFRFRQETEVNEPLSDIEDEHEEILPVHLGKAPSKRKVVSSERTTPQVGHLCAVDTEKYSDYWPQIGEIESIENDKMTIIWYKGARTTKWSPWILKVGKNRKKLDRGTVTGRHRPFRV